MDKYKIVGRRVKVVVVVVLNHTVNVWAQVTPGEYEGTIEKSCQARCTGAVGCGALGTVNSVKGAARLKVARVEHSLQGLIIALMQPVVPL